MDGVQQGHGHRVEEASVQTGEEEDTCVVVVDHEDHVQDPVWGGTYAHWLAEVQTLLLDQPRAYLGVHWPLMEAHANEEVRLEEEGPVGGGKGRVVVVGKVQVEASGRGLQEAAVEGGGQVEVPGQQGQVSP